MFQNFKNRLTITGEIETCTAIHIGAAEDNFSPGGVKNPFLRNASGLPFIPGSSLKGVMRSFMERLFSEVEQGERLAKHVDFREGEWIPVCTPAKMCFDLSKQDSSDSKYVEYRDLVKARGREDDLSDFIYKNSCIICRIFGSQVNGSKLLIRDAEVCEGTFVEETDFELRTGVSIDRDLGKAVQGRFYDFEVVPQGTRFRFQAVAENVDEQEKHCLQILFRAMGLGLITIGGMTSRGLGSIKLTNVDVTCLDETNLLDVLLGRQKMKPLNWEGIAEGGEK